MKHQTKLYDSEQQSYQELIGKGSFAEVYKKVIQGKPYAIKKISKLLINRQGRQNQLKREIEISKKINHENIIKFYQFRQDDPKNYILKMEFFDGQNLRKYLLSQQHRSLVANDPKKAKKLCTKICLDLINALAEVRSKMVTNRDIKPDNILISIQGNNIRTKMIDFGQATFNIADAMTQVGTKGYMAPQIYYGQGQYNDECDMWSLGQCFYQIFQGTRPNSDSQQFFGSPFRENFYPQSKNDFDYFYEFLIFEGINLSKKRTPGPFRQIIRKLLHPDPKQRLTFLQMLQILNRRLIEIRDIFLEQAIEEREKQRLNQCLAKQKYTKYEGDRIKQAYLTIKDLCGVYKKVHTKIDTGNNMEKNQVRRVLISIFWKIQSSMGEIQQIMNLKIEDFFQEILAGVVNMQQFQNMARQVQKLINNNKNQQFHEIVITAELQAFLTTQFEREGEGIIKIIQKYAG